MARDRQADSSFENEHLATVSDLSVEEEVDGAGGTLYKDEGFHQMEN